MKECFPDPFNIAIEAQSLLADYVSLIGDSLTGMCADRTLDISF